MFEVRNEANGVELLLYDRIGKDEWSEGGIVAADVIDALKAAKGKPVTLRIDSGGGDVFEAFAICSAIQRYEGKTTAYVDGLAASAASYIAVVCDEVIMRDYAYLMIHCASSLVWGNARDMEDMAARLRNIDDNLAEIYVKRSKLTKEQVLDYMADETWFTAAQALEAGLATSVMETEERIAACIDPELARNYKHAPEAVLVQALHRAMEAESHAATTLPDEEQQGAAFVVLDGRIFKKGERA